jgi:hypothetical protein
MLMKLFAITLLLISNFAFTQVTIVIHEKTGYEGKEDFADRSAKILAEVINSEKFKAAILNGTFTEKNELTNQQVYDLIMQAHELNGPGGTDKVIDLRVRTMSAQVDGKKWMRWCRPGSAVRTIGKDGGGTGIVATCPQHLTIWANRNDVARLAGHYAHEYMHILGFSHLKKKSTSLVYKVGNIVEQLIRNGF